MEIIRPVIVEFSDVRVEVSNLCESWKCLLVESREWM